MTRAGLLGVTLALGCGGGGGGGSPPPPQPPPPVAAPPSTTLLTPTRVAGSYRLRADIQRQGQRQGQRRAQGRAGETPLRLENAPVAAPDPAIPSAVQFGASVSLAGYTRAPRGRNAQAAAWYPVAGDSLVIQFSTQAQPGAQIQLRGVHVGQGLRGEIWLVSASGNTFQLGTFVATRQR